MKHLTKLFLLAMLVVLASCQNETLTEGASSVVEEEAAPEDKILTSDGEEDDALILNSESEIMPIRAKLNFAASSNSPTREGTVAGSDCIPDLEALELYLPDVVTATTTAKPGNDAYFDIDISGDSIIAGTDIPAWCVDQDLSLDEGETLEFNVYSSYETLPDGEFEFPENFDLVNWLINQDFIGKTSPSGGTYTFGHIQYAIWLLVDDSVCRECRYLTLPVGEWNDDADANIAKAEELAQAARDNGEGFKPECGQKVAVILNPEGRQAIIITVDVPEKEEECSDCEGKVTKLELEFDWHYAKRVKIYQRKENTYCGVKIFDKVLQPGEKFCIEGANHDYSFGKYIYFYIGNRCYYYTKIRTDCNLKIGPGYEKGVFNVISGKSSQGGELCEYVKPDYYCYKYRHWSSKYYRKYRYRNHGY